MIWLADCAFLMKTNIRSTFPVVRVYCWLRFSLSTGATPNLSCSNATCPIDPQLFMAWRSSVLGVALCLCWTSKFVVNLIPPACWGLSEWQPCLLVYWQLPPCFMSSTSMMGVCSSSLSRLLMKMLSIHPSINLWGISLIAGCWLHFEPPLSPAVQPVVLLHLLHDSPDWLKRYCWRLSAAFVKSN